MPSDPNVIKEWLANLKKKVDAKEAAGTLAPLDPLLVQFKQLIETDATLIMQYSQMFTDPFKATSLTPASPVGAAEKQASSSTTSSGGAAEQMAAAAPSTPGPKQTGKHDVIAWTSSDEDVPIINNYDEMFKCINEILQSYTPCFSDSGLVGFPINAILNWPMATMNGYAAFLSKEANEYWGQVIQKWQDGVLATSKSLSVLTDDDKYSWFSKLALCKMTNLDPDTTTQETALKEFLRLYKYRSVDPKKHLGFTSWDDFFTREYNKGIRPVAEPNDQSVVTSACESYPFALQKKVLLSDVFWIKKHKYSLKHLFGKDMIDTAKKFVGGTVYQAFLSATSYHRWHSPVNGTIVDVKKIPGTYYSSTPCVAPDSAAPDKSQGYICHVATRAIIVIQADNPAIGTMCVVLVGMAEVSTCQVFVGAGAVVKKGDQLGTFHFGGSTHCLIFGPDVKITFIDRVCKDLQEGENSETNIPVNSKLATVKP